MLGAGQSSGGRRYVFPIIASLLVIIAVLFLLANRDKPNVAATTMSVPGQPNVQTRSMGLADKVVIPLTLMSTPLRGVESMIDNMRSRSEVYEENVQLKARLKELSDAEMRANALAMNIKRFENLLSADVGLDIPLQKIGARVVSENNGPFARSALLNVGAKSGVRVGHTVMTEFGLYGHVVAVGKRSSRVLLLQDINSRIAVMSVRSESRAILVGTNAAQPNLLFVARGADWQDGDNIVTSGDEGVLPRGLPVGVMKQRSAETRNVILTSADKPVDWVWVIPFVKIPTPEDEPANELDLQNPELTGESATETNTQLNDTTAVPLVAPIEGQE